MAMPEPATAKPGQSLRITFVLPGFSRHPSGGYRVVFDYASELQRRGHRCQVVAPIVGCAGPHAVRVGASERLKDVARYAAFRGRGSWRELDSTVKFRYPVIARPADLPAGDIVVATAWRTAELVAAAPVLAGKPVYLLQGYETWDSPGQPDLVDQTWQLPFIKCVVARWLFDQAVTLGVGDRTFYTPNGLRLDQLRCTTPIEQRNGRVVGMLVSENPVKGAQTGLAALELARKQLDSLDVQLCGLYRPSFPLPPWMTFNENLQGPELNDYFNRLGVFVHPSLSEGWGLMASEAMAMGAALVSGDNPAIFDFVRPGRDGLVVPRESPQALADAIVRLATDDGFRVGLALSAQRQIQRFSLERAVSRFEDVLLYAAGRGPRPAAMA
jgi:glycosyltransferase involved in cell wall biosynthesis